MWRVDEKELKMILRPAKKADNFCEDMPSRGKLGKRVRTIAALLSGKGDAPEEEEKDDSPQDNSAGDSKQAANKSHGFHVIDQSDRHNILLAEMMKGQLHLKQTTKVGRVKLCVSLMKAEIDARITDVSGRLDENTASFGVLSSMKEHIDLYSNNVKRGGRAAKNVLRVMVRFCLSLFLVPC